MLLARLIGATLMFKLGHEGFLKVGRSRSMSNFPDIAFKDLASPLVRRMAYSVVALHVAAHNCDFYITKYAGQSIGEAATSCHPVRRRCSALGGGGTTGGRSGCRAHVDKISGEASSDPLTECNQSLPLVFFYRACCFLEKGDTFWTSHMDAPVSLAG